MLCWKRRRKIPATWSLTQTPATWPKSLASPGSGDDRYFSVLLSRHSLSQKSAGTPVCRRRNHQLRGRIRKPCICLADGKRLLPRVVRRHCTDFFPPADRQKTDLAPRSLDGYISWFNAWLKAGAAHRLKPRCENGFAKVEFRRPGETEPVRQQRARIA